MKYWVFILTFSLWNLVGYEKSQAIEETLWESIQSYLLPSDHPIKARLDHIFLKSRAIESEKTLKRADFRFSKHDKWDNIYIAKHRSLRGFFIKFYTDDQMGINELPVLLRRIQGANLISDIIERHQFQDQFKAPKKWLYPLPDAPEDPSFQRKHFVLVVEDMQILQPDFNARIWKNNNYVTRDLLAKLHLILVEGGLIDSIYIDNIPFSVDRKIAFIDTEHFNDGPIRFHRLTPFLPKKTQHFWDSL